MNTAKDRNKKRPKTGKSTGGRVSAHNWLSWIRIGSEHDKG